MMMLKLISALLSYPTAELLQALDELVLVIESDSALPDAEKAGLRTLIEVYRQADLLESQQCYVELFDRGRNLSLHLFEHIHGESRDRGQAMVELLRLYESHGFAMTARELPDYIPLFLEYLSHRPLEEAREWLAGAMPVLALLEARLTERESPYAALFLALRSLAGGSSDFGLLRERAAIEGPDETVMRMDEIWEEEAVSFMGNPGACQAPSMDAPRHSPWRGDVERLP